MVTDFSNHVAGDPYVLTRKDFLRFAGLLSEFEAFLAVLQQQSANGRLPGNGHNYEPEQQAFWATLASFEAMRRFQPGEGCCDSFLYIEAGTDSALACQMEWTYESTSGTVFYACEEREYNKPYSVLESVQLPEPQFTVTIPADRDQHGRSHYEALRRGGTYRDF